VDTEEWLFSGYQTERCEVFDLFGGISKLELLTPWRTLNYNSLATTTFQFADRTFSITAVLLNEDHEIVNWNIGAGPPAVESGCGFCFLPRSLYSVFPMTGYERTLSAGMKTFGEMKEKESEWERAFTVMKNKKGWPKVQTHIHQLFGNPVRIPPLLDGATFNEQFIIRIHPIMHNQV
jgi:hypothetical protein